MNAERVGIYWSCDASEGTWHIERDVRAESDAALCGYKPRPSWTRIAQMPVGERCAMCLRLYQEADIRPRAAVSP